MGTEGREDGYSKRVKIRTRNRIEGCTRVPTVLSILSLREKYKSDTNV